MTYYHRRSIRLKGYDYSSCGAYFITICTHKKENIFGEIHNGQVLLNDTGKIANKYWLEIPSHYPNVILDSYIIMPNHIHGIIHIINDCNIPPVGANNHSPLYSSHGTSKSVGAIIRGYKIGVTKWFRDNLNRRNLWQRNYYEKIIRNRESLINIRQYITDNPSRTGE